MLRFRFVVISLVASSFAVAAAPMTAIAQARVGADSATRLTRLGRDLAYRALGFHSAGSIILSNSRRLGDGCGAVGRRAAPRARQFGRGTTRSRGGGECPLDYRRCKCRGTGDRIGRAFASAITDEMPDGSRALAVPRIVGAYVGAFAQATWRPPTSGRTRVALVNGTTSLAIGVLINLYHEFR